MTDYTPITAEVKSHYMYLRSGKWRDNPMPFGDEFDRWLAEYTRQQREEAWDEGADSGYEMGRRNLVDQFNPYRRAEA